MDKRREPRSEEHRQYGESRRHWRERHKLTLEQMAGMIGVSWTTLQRWETGQFKPSKFVGEKLDEVKATVEARD